MHCGCSPGSFCQILKAAQAPLCPAAWSVSATLALGRCMHGSQRTRSVTEILCMQVDKHKSDVSREVNEIHRRSEQEKTQRTCMMR